MTGERPEGVGPVEAHVLNGWKEIAAYLGKSVRSVQRWEAELGLPIRRMQTADGQIVFAEPADLRQWRRGREAEPALVKFPAVERADVRVRLIVGVVVGLALTGLVVCCLASQRRES